MMHPEILRRLATAHIIDLLTEAEGARRARQDSRARRARPGRRSRTAEPALSFRRGGTVSEGHLSWSARRDPRAPAAGPPPAGVTPGPARVVAGPALERSR